MCQGGVRVPHPINRLSYCGSLALCSSSLSALVMTCGSPLLPVCNVATTQTHQLKYNCPACYPAPSATLLSCFVFECPRKAWAAAPVHQTVDLAQLTVLLTVLPTKCLPYGTGCPTFATDFRWSCSHVQHAYPGTTATISHHI